MRGAFFFSCAAIVVLVTAAAAHDAGAATKVRGANDKARQLLVAGQELSPTVRQLVAAIESRDLIVLVSVEAPAVSNAGRFRGSTRLLGTAHGQRFASIWIDESSMPPCAVGLLAHELQHALEVAQAAWVVDQQQMYELFSRIGREWRSQHFETAAAIAVETRARAEFESGSRTRAHG
jgi:hypothetical protein